MLREFRRIAIVNRGEAAMRFIHAVREFNKEFGTSLTTIALFTEPDRYAMFVREADEAVYLGPPHVLDANGNHKSSYVDYDRLRRVMLGAKAEAVWVGWGFVAEHAAFADLCEECGIVFIGPTGDTMRKLGDKITSKLLAQEAGIPVAPWSGGPVETLDAAMRWGEQLGYPLLIKATAGGGGHGIRKVESESQLAGAFESARSEAFRAFGNPTVFMEQLVRGARHIEVQVIADQHGNAWAAGVRDCTIQRRHQKVFEEAPSPVLLPDQDRMLRQMAVNLSRVANYHNAGTVEFLYDWDTREFAFMEMNTRLQVEHPVTELTTGLDLVKLQLHVARGERLEGEAPATVGHAIEVRLNAEDPDNAFAPAPGVIERFRFGGGPGIRIDAGVAEGDSVPAEFDSMMAKVIAWGRTRDEALARLQRTLKESAVVVRGGTSNKSFLLDLVRRSDVRRSHVDTAWLDRLAAAGEHLSREYGEVALLQAAIEAYDAELAVEQRQFYASALRGRPAVRSEVGRNIELRHRGVSYTLGVLKLDVRKYRISVNGVEVDAEHDRLGTYEHWLTAFGRRFHVVSIFEGLHYRIEIDGVAHRVERDDGGVVRAPSPAVIVSVGVKPGDVVAAGQSLAVLEAMKMEMHVTAPFAGRVRQVMAVAHVQVGPGTPLVQIDPEVEAEIDIARSGALFTDVPAARSIDDATKCFASLDELRQLVLGFDFDPANTSRLQQEWNDFCDLASDSNGVRDREDEILKTFADISALFQRHPEIGEGFGSEGPSAEASLFVYLRTMDADQDLAPGFIDSLRRAVQHYGIHNLDRTPELEETLLWIYKSHSRAERQLPLVVSLLERRLEAVEELAGSVEESFRALLDRLIQVTRGVYPAVSDLAREVRYRYFDHPLFERARKKVYQEAEGHLAQLAADPQGANRYEHLRALVECPQPLLSVFSGQFEAANRDIRQLMLEVLASRYYRIRNLSHFHAVVVNGFCMVTAEYPHEGKQISLVAAQSDYTRLHELIEAVCGFVQQLPAEHDIVIDLFGWRAGVLAKADLTEASVRDLLNQSTFPRPIRRVSVAVASSSATPLGRATQHFTYRPVDGAFQEEVLYRGIHPMMAKRLHLWRLANFNIERLPSAEDIYLLRAVARENPKDERLIACAEIRDLTPIRDESGDIVELPHLERMFTEAAAAMRLARARSAQPDKLHWNRILLYVWPPMTLQQHESNLIVHKLAAAAEGLGIEQVVVRASIPSPRTGELRDMVVRISGPGSAGLLTTFRPAAGMQVMKPLTEYDQKVVRMRQRGFIYPYEIIRMLTPAGDHTRADFPPGTFTEYDLDGEGMLAPVDRPYGRNASNIIVGVVRNFTERYPEGMTRVILLGDPSADLGALAEPECRRIIAGLDLAEALDIPLEWFPISAGAKISMDSGVENMDWIAHVLRRIVEFTQAGREINLVIDGINVGAQPYWNAEATMLMHTKGILVMTPKAAMVLTGKRALDYSGSVSAEDNIGIGGYDRIMGFNGQAQYWARDIYDGCRILLQHYEHTYVAPGERYPRRAFTADPIDRDVRTYPHSSKDESFATVGEVFSEETNPGRKKSFDVRSVMRAVSDQDHAPLERWAGMRAADTAVVWDAHLGGFPVCLIGFESHPVARLGFIPADGPDVWTAGTLFPLSSKKVARAINSASNNRPVVILANLSGFDGSPESMRRWQLEFGAEIGRSVVNFNGPMIFCVISRYHGGAYVVFSRRLNENLEVAALEGTHASVIGGAPAAAVVFAGEVEKRTKKDPRIRAALQAIEQADVGDKARLQSQYPVLFNTVHSEKLGQMAVEFDGVHSVERALRVGALDRIISPSVLRLYLIDAVERGIRKSTARMYISAGSQT